jgi:hypothetical protein
VEAAVTVRRVSRRVLLVWLALAAVLAVVVVLEYRDVIAARARRGGDADAGRLLPVPADQLFALEVADAGTRHRFERDAGGVWFYHGTHGAADAGHTHPADPDASRRIEQAVAAFGRARIERRIGRAAPGATYGVTTPKVVILAYRRDEAQPLAQFAVGDVAPDTVSHYVDIVGGAGVVTIPTYHVDNLLKLIASVKDSAR